jgi:hypothetical protein
VTGTGSIAGLGEIADTWIFPPALTAQYHFNTEGTIKPYPQELIGTFLYQCIAAVMNLITSGNEAHQRSSYIQQGFDIFWDGIKAG